MKHLTKTFLIFLLLSLSIGSCKKDDDGENGTPQDSMAEYFHCKINGIAFNPSSTFTCNSRLFGYYPEAGNGIDAGYLVIRGRECPPGGNLVAVRIFGLNPSTGTINFLEPAEADSCSPVFRSADGILYEELISGHVHFQEFRPSELPDGDLGLVEGTFEFSVANAELDSTIHITEGHFRFRIQQTW